MAKIELNHMFLSASGKLCKKTGTYIALNKKTGKMYQAEYHEREYANTAKQQEVKTTFTAKAKAASAWWNANKPIVSADGTVTREATADYQKMMKAYKANDKYGNPYAYLRSLVNDDLTITIGSTTVNAPSGEGNTPGGGQTGDNEQVEM